MPKKPATHTYTVTHETAWQRLHPTMTVFAMFEPIPMQANYTGGVYRDVNGSRRLYQLKSDTEVRTLFNGFDVMFDGTKEGTRRDTHFLGGLALKDIKTTIKPGDVTLQQEIPSGNGMAVQTIRRPSDGGSVASTTQIMARAGVETHVHTEEDRPTPHLAPMLGARLGIGVLISEVKAVNPYHVLNAADVPETTRRIRPAIAPGVSIGFDEGKIRPGLRLTSDATLAKDCTITQTALLAVKHIKGDKINGGPTLHAGITYSTLSLNHDDDAQANRVELTPSHGLGAFLHAGFTVPLTRSKHALTPRH